MDFKLASLFTVERSAESRTDVPFVAEVEWVLTKAV